MTDDDYEDDDDWFEVQMDRLYALLEPGTQLSVRYSVRVAIPLRAEDVWSSQRWVNVVIWQADEWHLHCLPLDGMDWPDEDAAQHEIMPRWGVVECLMPVASGDVSVRVLN